MLSLAASDLRRLGCFAGIIGSYSLYGLLLEKIVRDVEISTVGMLFVASSLYTLAAYVAGSYTNRPPKPFDQPVEYAQIAASYLGAMWCSTFALHNVSYVTQVLAKSGKAIPIMLAGLLRGKRQKRGQWVSVLFVVAGVVSFTLLNEMKVSKESTMAGMVLISASLCLDGVTGTLEDRLVERAPEGGKPGPLDFMFNINLWAVPFCAVIMLVNQEFGSLFQLLQSGQSGLQVIAWATSGAVGQCFIFYVIATDGAVVCSIATTLRKFTTVLLSIVVFGHTIGFGQMLAITVVFFGVGGLLHQKRNPDITPRQAIMFLSSLGAALLVMHLPTSALGTSANTGLRKGAF